jgi:type I restriction enzyme S subunit
MFDEELITWSIDGGGHFFHRPKHRFSVTNRLWVLAHFASTDICYKYLAYQLQFLHSRKSFDYTLKAHPSVIRKSYTIPLPRPREQRAIAEALSEADSLIQALEALIAKKRIVKRAAMQQLLNGRTRLRGFAGKWVTKRLGEIGEISGAGVDKTMASNEASVRLLNYLDVYHKTFILSKDITQTVSARPDQAQRCAIRKGGVFFTPTSEVPHDIGRSVVAMEDIPDSVYSYHVVRLRLAGCWDYRFRAYVFDTESFYSQASTYCEGSGTRYVLTLPKFRALTVRFPPSVDEQRAIAAVLYGMDSEISAVEQRLDKTRAIKQGMMQQLLTGRVRLVEPAAKAAP